MKINKIIAAVLCVMMVLPLCFAAVAETTITSDTLSVYDVKLLKDSKRLIIRKTSDRSYLLCDLEGNPLSETAYASMSDASYGLIEVSVESDSANCIGVINANGAVVVPTEYGDIKYLSDRWVLGVVLEPSNEEHYDYTTYLSSEKHFFLISRYDVYYMGTKVGEMGRTEYKYGTPYGAYLMVQNELGERTGYDSAFNKSPYAIRYSSEYDYDYQTKIVTHVCSGLPAFTEGCELKAEDVAVPTYERNGILYDLQGNQLGDFSAYSSIYDPDNGYVCVRTKDGKYGITDVNGNVLIAAELSERPYNYTGLFASGYELVSKDGKLCFATPEGIVFTSKISSSVSNNKVGVFCHVENDDGTRCVLTPMGQLPDPYKNVMYDSYNTGKILVVQNTNEEIYVIGMGGEVVIPVNEKIDSLYDYQVSYDGTIVVANTGRNSDRLYDFVIYHVDYDVNSVEALDDGTWVCECGSVNDNNYCPFCGKPNPKNAQ